MPHLTRAEAEALLPKVEPLLEDLRRRVGAFRRQPSDPVAREIRALLAELAALGVEVKDPDQGLIDFRTMREGREVYLCWKLGEGARIMYWHDLETGYAGRRPLDRLN
ncbi:MAG TPA: DUF2203 family protein [Candidatus Limnocylindria bacterium]|nr:DUF2203 family protein [Candidatus Limnocylindria bacterium]